MTSAPEPHGIRITETGGPEVMRYQPLTDLPDPAELPPGTVLIDVAAAGVNFIDTYQRGGLYPMPLPTGLGQEGAGVIRALAPDVAAAGGFTVGSRVAWLDVIGSYATMLLAPADRLVAVPDDLDLTLAAAVMLQGATAYYLAHLTFPVTSGTVALVHAGAGGVGQLLTQMVVAAGGRVVATVGSQAKQAVAEAAGAHDVIRYDTTDFADQVEELLGPHAIDVVYDGVGAATFDGGLRVLRPRGLMVTYGNASGPVPPIAPLQLASGGSLFLTRPTLAHYATTTEQLRGICEPLLADVASGALRVDAETRLPLTEAIRAHELLSGRATTGKVLLLP